MRSFARFGRTVADHKKGFIDLDQEAWKIYVYPRRALT